MTRVLFLHASMERSSEYNVHRTLAEHADPGLVESYFIWQKRRAGQAQNNLPDPTQIDRHFSYDFGRDLSIQPKPSRVARAGMMAQRVPGGFVMLLQKIRELQPNFIYTSQQQLEVHLARLASMMLHIPHIIHLHYPVGPWLGAGMVRTITHTPFVIAPSEYVRQTAINAGVAPNRISVQFETTPLKKFNIPRDPLSLRAELNIPADAPIVVSVGRLDPGKGHIPLINAFAQVHKQLPEARLLIIGSSFTRDGYEQQLKQRVVDLGLSERVIFIPWRSDLSAVYAGADVFCLMSENEAFGLVFLEAMSGGLPVVSCRSGGIPEIVRHNETGLLSQPGDVATLTTHMLTLLRDRELAERMGHAGRARALSVFAPEVAAQQWGRLVQRLHREAISKPLNVTY